MHCDNPLHAEAADNIIVDILQSVEKAAYDMLPVPAPQRFRKTRSSKPGWHEMVHPYRQSAQFWHQVWVSAGRPLNNQLHLIMKRTRNLFHFQVRKLRKASDTIAKNKLLEACINGEGNLFSEIKKIRNTQPCVANSMDGVKVGVENHFKNIYTNLYNSVDDHEDLNMLVEQVNKKVNTYHLHDVLKLRARKNPKDSFFWNFWGTITSPPYIFHQF